MKDSETRIKKPERIIPFSERNKTKFIVLSIILAIILLSFLRDYYKNYPKIEYLYGTDEVFVENYSGGKYEISHIVTIPSSTIKDGIEYSVVGLEINSFNSNYLRFKNILLRSSSQYQVIDKLILPASIQSIRKHAFLHADIKEIVFTADVANIEPYAFNSSNITNITYGKDVNTIKKTGFEAEDEISFGRRDFVKQITFESDSPPAIDESEGEYIFKSIEFVSVPQNCLYDYETAFREHFPHAEFIETEKD